MHFAAFNRHVACLEALFKMGGDADAKNEVIFSHISLLYTHTLSYHSFYPLNLSFLYIHTHIHIRALVILLSKFNVNL